MTTQDAIDHLRAALASGRPHCFVQVSPQALELVLALIDSTGESDDGAD